MKLHTFNVYVQGTHFCEKHPIGDSKIFVGFQRAKTHRKALKEYLRSIGIFHSTPCKLEKCDAIFALFVVEKVDCWGKKTKHKYYSFGNSLNQ